MEMSSTRSLNVAQLTVWAALNDPEILRASIPGCDKFEPAGENEYAVAVTAAIGPVKEHFTGRVRLADIHPAEGYTLRFEGQGGAAGFAKGDATVTLAPHGENTLLSYQVKAHVGGRLAQVGSRLIDGAAKKLADEFFSNFSRQIAPAAAVPAAQTAKTAARVPAWVWILLALTIAALGYYFAQA